MGTISGAYLFFVVLAVAVAIAWIFVPFAIFGTKPILAKILKALEENNRLLTENKSLLSDAVKRGTNAAPTTSPAPPAPDVKRTNWG